MGGMVVFYDYLHSKNIILSLRLTKLRSIAREFFDLLQTIK